jgi:hypothetical protein
MDPFFQAKYKQPHLNSPYIEDINRTYYKGPKVPQRNSKTFERALAYREQEKHRIEAVVRENEDLWRQIADYDAVAKRAEDHIRKQSSTILALNSKLRASDVANTSRNRGSGTSSEHSVQSVEGGSERSAADVPGEVLRTPVPDSRGQASEHIDEGRQAVGAGESTGESVQIRAGDGDSSADAEGGVRSE